MSDDVRPSLFEQLAPYERTVPRHLSRYTARKDWIWYISQCCPESFRYIMAHREIPGICFVLGKCYPDGDRTGQFEPHAFDAGFWHAWVELPDALIFEATRQRFYDRAGWVQVYQPHHITHHALHARGGLPGGEGRPAARLWLCPLPVAIRRVFAPEGR
jgi:hypothetical protein